MRLAVSVDEGKVSMHFGRCQNYVIFDIENGKIINREVVENPGHQPFFLPKFLAEKKVKVLITGGIGPRAINLFKELDIKIISNVEGSLDDVIKKYLDGGMDENTEPCEEHENG